MGSLLVAGASPAIKEFAAYEAAAAFGKREGRDYCLPFQSWKVEKLAPSKFGIAVVSKNSGEVQGWVN